LAVTSPYQRGGIEGCGAVGAGLGGAGEGGAGVGGLAGGGGVAVSVVVVLGWRNSRKATTAITAKTMTPMRTSKAIGGLRVVASVALPCDGTVVAAVGATVGKAPIAPLRKGAKHFQQYTRSSKFSA